MYLLKAELKRVRDVEAAQAARKRPRAGMTVRTLGTHQFFTQEVLDVAMAVAAARKGIGKSKAVDPLKLPEREPSAEDQRFL